jgi:peptidoglycan/LPS O-acetylase OafA/YrhL
MRVLRSLATLPDRIGRPTTRVAYIPQIDGLRCLAIVLVLLWHASLRASRYTGALDDAGYTIQSFYAFLPHGEIGVDLFFFISGFVIAQPFLHRRREDWSVWQFYARRMRRIYPPYAAALSLCFLILGIIGHRPENTHAFDASAGVPLTDSFAASLFYLHSIIFDVSSRLNPPMWSLEIEIQFYLLSPLLLWLYTAPPRRATRAVGAFTGMLLLMAAINVFGHDAFDGRFRLGLVAHMNLFIAGAVAADFAREDFTPVLPVSSDAILLCGLVGLVSCGLWLTQTDARPTGAWSRFFTELALLASIGGLYWGAMKGRLGRIVFGSRWICLIGTMCYSIYLTHIVVMQAVYELLLKRIPLHNSLLIWAVYFLVLPTAALAVGSIFYVAIERPFMTPRKLPSSRPGVSPGTLS